MRPRRRSVLLAISTVTSGALASRKITLPVARWNGPVGSSGHAGSGPARFGAGRSGVDGVGWMQRPASRPARRRPASRVEGGGVPVDAEAQRRPRCGWACAGAAPRRGARRREGGRAAACAGGERARRARRKASEADVADVAEVNGRVARRAPAQRCLPRRRRSSLTAGPRRAKTSPMNARTLAIPSIATARRAPGPRGLLDDPGAHARRSAEAEDPPAATGRPGEQGGDGGEGRPRRRSARPLAKPVAEVKPSEDDPLKGKWTLDDAPPRGCPRARRSSRRSRPTSAPCRASCSRRQGADHGRELRRPGARHPAVEDARGDSGRRSPLTTARSSTASSRAS